MEVTHVLPRAGQNTTRPDTGRSIEQVRKEFSQHVDVQLREREERISREQIKQLTQELRNVTRAFNKRLSFSYNDKLDQMVVKVIDRETDTVIKELPPSELQRVHLRIREAIGLLLDESV
ncbi:MAG: flagellar protein FlaG [Alkalispirochaeta sp.]